MSSVIYKLLVPTLPIPHATLSKFLSLHPAGLYFFTFTVGTKENILSTVPVKGLNIWNNFYQSSPLGHNDVVIVPVSQLMVVSGKIHYISSPSFSQHILQCP